MKTKMTKTLTILLLATAAASAQVYDRNTVDILTNSPFIANIQNVPNVMPGGAWHLAQADAFYEQSGLRYRVHYDYDPMHSFTPSTYPKGKPHFDAIITVFIDGSGVIGKPMSGTYVEGGCFEDVPSNWVWQAKSEETNTALDGSDSNIVGVYFFNNAIPPVANVYTSNGFITLVPCYGCVIVTNANGTITISATNILKSKPPIDVYEPHAPYTHAMYSEEGELMFEDASRSEFAFHHNDRDCYWTHDFDTNWVTLWTADGTNHDVGVVTSNYISKLEWNHTTNRVVWKSTKLALPQPPQRDVPLMNGIWITNSPITNIWWGPPCLIISNSGGGLSWTY